jgi:hypothetical protein
MEECLGTRAVAVVKALTESTACPAAARGWWGSLFLGLMLCATAGVPVNGAQKLLEALWRMSAAKSGLQDTKLAPPAAAVGDSAAVEGSGISAGDKDVPWVQEEEEGPLNRYSLREFVSALVLLLRYGEMHRGYDSLDVKQLHDKLLQVKRGTSRCITLMFSGCPSRLHTPEYSQRYLYISVLHPCGSNLGTWKLNAAWPSVPTTSIVWKLAVDGGHKCCC